MAIEEFITGSRVDQPDVDRVLTTVLFVDVLGSTERVVSELGDRRWQALLDQLVGTVERQLLTHRVVLVDRSGDGILATFDGPAHFVVGSEIRFDDRGEFALKGVRERWELYATSN